MATDFDRARPLFRFFLDEADGGPAWHEVTIDNRPGRRLDDAETYILNAHVAMADWGEAFEAATAKHRKGTIYFNDDTCLLLTALQATISNYKPPYYMLCPPAPGKAMVG